MELFCCIHQPYRVFNTWLGDPSKVILLEELVKAIREMNLLESARRTGATLIDGMSELQVGLLFAIENLSLHLQHE